MNVNILQITLGTMRGVGAILLLTMRMWQIMMKQINVGWGEGMIEYKSRDRDSELLNNETDRMRYSWARLCVDASIEEVSATLIGNSFRNNHQAVELGCFGLQVRILQVGLMPQIPSSFSILIGDVKWCWKRGLQSDNLVKMTQIEGHVLQCCH